MTLTLLAVSLNDQPLSQPITAHFDMRGGTIGRADHNTMALPDPERHISRLQAEVVASGDRFIVRNVGAANPITVAGRSLGHNDTAPLNHGDEIRIGGYLLQVDSRPRGAALDVTRGRAMLSTPNATLTPGMITGMNPLPRSTVPAPPVPMPMPAAPLAAPAAATTGNLDTFGGLAGVGAPKAGNPFADLLGPAPASGPGAAAPAVTAAPAAARDPFADLFGASSPGHPAAAAPLAAAPFAAPAPVTPPAAPAPQATAAPAWAAPPPRAADPFADPFASLLPPPAGVPSASPAVARAPAAAAPRLPENFDPFASLPSQPPPAASQAAVGNDPFAALLPSGPGPSIDAMFGLGNASPGAGDPLANFMAGAPAAHAAAPGSAASGKAGGATTDPIEALFGGAPPAPAPAPVQSDHVPALNAAFVPPRIRTADPLAGLKPAAEPAAGKPASMPDPGAAAEPPAPTPAPAAAPAPIAAAAVAAPPPPLPPVFMPAPVPAPASLPAAMPSARSSPPASEGAANADSADATRLWAALCEGAGIHLPQPGAGTEAQMRDIGRILRSAVDGTLRLMAVRTSTRHEMRANVTIIQARNNNPLKFSPDAQAALEALLQPSMRGFLDGPAAMEDAMQDLVGHSIGSVAGMRAALEGVLDRFAPEQLESKLSTKSVLDSLLTGPRKARLWDLYLQHQSTIRDEAQDDFHALFGKAFLAAYEQQVAQLKRNARAAQGGGVAAPAQPGAGS